MKSKLLLFLLILGLTFRILISFYTYSGDVTNHVIWGEDAVKHGLSGLYDKSFEKIYGHTSPNYPPFIILTFAFLYLLKNLIYQIAWYLNLSLPFFPSKLIFFLRDFDYYPYLLKLPAIFSDIGIAYLSYLFLKKTNRLTDTLITLFVLFNPAYFYNSAFWGQTDSIPLFFLLTSFYLLLYKKRFMLAGIAFTLGILSKQTVIIFTPLFLFSLFKLSSQKTFLKTLLASLLIFILIFLPFSVGKNILIYPFKTYLTKILLTPGIPYTSNHAFNFWYLLTGSRKVIASEKIILNLSFELLGYLIAGILIFVIFRRILTHSFRISHDLKKVFYVGYLTSFTSFLFLTKMHERHLLLVLPFLLLLIKDDKVYLFAYLFISLFNFLNMYHDWWSPNIRILMEILSLNYVTIVLTTLLFLLYLFNLKNFLVKEKKID